MNCKGRFSPILMEKYRGHNGPITQCCEDCKEHCRHAVKATRPGDYGFNRQDLPDPPGYDEALRRCD